DDRARVRRRGDCVWRRTRTAQRGVAAAAHHREEQRPMAMTSRQRTEGAPLRRRLGLWSITVSGVGVVLGAGVYVLVGEASATAGDATWIAFLIAAALAALTGLAFAELSAMFPEAGASAAYAREAFGPRVGFITGWLDVSVNVIGAAAVGLGFGGYL